MHPTYVNISDRDEEHSLLPRWTLALNNSLASHQPSTCSLLLEWSTRTDEKWGNRANLHRTIQIHLTPKEIDAMILKIAQLPAQYPSDCLGIDQVHTHGGHSATRSNQGSVICRSISACIGQNHQPTIYIRKDSSIWVDSEIALTILKIIEPHCINLPRNPKPKSRFIP